MRLHSSLLCFPPVPIFLFLRHLPTVLANAQDNTPLASMTEDIDISKRQTNRCQGSDVECAPPTDPENMACCPPTQICTLMEHSDKEGVFIAYCVPDPRACYPGLFSCPHPVNSCCRDGYLCDLRTWENSTYPVCLATYLRLNNTSKSGFITTSSPTDSTISTSIADSVVSEGGESATYLHRSTLVGLVVGAICGSVVVTLVVVFSVRKYRRRRTKVGGTLIEQPNYGVPQPNDTKDSGPYESGGAEVLEAGGSGLAELPGQGKSPAGPQLWHELPTGVDDSTDPQVAQSGDEDSRQPDVQESHSNNSVGSGTRVQEE